MQKSDVDLGGAPLPRRTSVSGRNQTWAPATLRGTSVFEKYVLQRGSAGGVDLRTAVGSIAAREVLLSSSRSRDSGEERDRLFVTGSYLGHDGPGEFDEEAEVDGNEAAPLTHVGLRYAVQALAKGDVEDEVTGILAIPSSTWFQTVTALAIFLNAVVIGLETDITSVYWWWLEQALLVFFLCELILRLYCAGWTFFVDRHEVWWNWFDFSIVISGILDQWLMCIVFKGHRQHGMFMIARLLRLLRAFRLFRLVRLVRPLHTLSQGILDAMTGMFWILVFMAMWMYSISILCTRLIGHGLLFEDFLEMAEDPEVLEARAYFSTVSASLFSLFELISNWSLMPIVLLLDVSPVFRCFFVSVVIYATWAMLSVMTGVVSENMIAIRDQSEQDKLLQEEKLKRRITCELEQIFLEGDTDHSGTMDYDEFNELVNSKHVRDLMQCTRVTLKDLLDMFTWLDHDDSREVTIDGFLEAFRWAVEPVRGKSIFKLEQRIVKAIAELGKNTERAVETHFDPLIRTVKKVSALAELFKTLRNNVAQKRKSSSVFAALGTRLQACGDRLGDAHLCLDTVVTDMRRIHVCMSAAKSSLDRLPGAPRHSTPSTASTPNGTLSGTVLIPR